MINIVADKNSALNAKQTLKALGLPPAKRKRLLLRVANTIRQVSKQNITRQQTPDGKAWAARKKKRKGQKKKMLMGMKNLVVTGRVDENAAHVTLSKGAYAAHGAVVGNFHQKGNKRTQKKHRDRSGRTKPLKMSDPCTRGQAKALKAIGWTVWARRINPDAKQGRRRVPTVKWMMANMQQREVLKAFAKLKEDGFIKVKGSWQITVPPRQFMGASVDKTQQAWARAFQGIDYGWDVKPKNIKRR